MINIAIDFHSYVFLLIISDRMKKRYKWIMRIFLLILILHVVLSVLLSTAFVAISMGEFGQPRFLEHNGCL